VLNEDLSEMSAIAEKHGGMIDKFVGDAMMVLFGAPTATSDKHHAVRAVRARPSSRPSSADGPPGRCGAWRGMPPHPGLDAARMKGSARPTLPE
jgi:class 3 adenylate cyclase